MARTIEQISQAIKADFISNTVLASAYLIDDTKTFDDQFSKISIESIMIYIFATAAYLLESTVDAFRSEIDNKLASIYVTSLQWYWAMCLRYQHGYELFFDDTNYTWKYISDVADAKVVKYAAVREVITPGQATVLRILVAGAGRKALNADQLNGFKVYVRKLGAAGMVYNITSIDAEKVGLQLAIVYDPLVLKSDGMSIQTASYPISDAIQSYFDGIEYGGVFSATKLMDVIQQIAGVVEVDYKGMQRAALVTDLRITTEAGCFEHDGAKSTITYSSI